MRRALVAAALVAFTLTGCTVDAGEPLDPIISPGAAEVAPTVEAPPVAGDTLTAEQARVMNRDLTDTLTAYKLADGTWVTVDKGAALPEAVERDAAVRAAEAASTNSLFASDLMDQVGTLTSQTGRTIYAVATFRMGCDGANIDGRWAVVDASFAHLVCATSRDDAITFANSLASADDTISVVVAG